MRWIVALLAASCTAAIAAPLVLGPQAFEITDGWASTIADASTEAREQAAACARPGNTCRPLAATARELSDAGGCGKATPVTAWRFANELKGGADGASMLQRLADTREVFACDGGSCLAVVHAKARKETRADVDGLSVCQVRVVAGVAGPPTLCRDALKRDTTGTVLLRGKVGDSITSCSMGVRDFDSVFKGRATDLASVRATVGDVLRAKPFGLSVVEDGSALVGTRTQLASSVLAGWREWVTVRVDVAARGPDTGTTITTTMLVSKQASSSRESWTPPSEAQEAAYLLALRNAFAQKGGVLETGVGR